MINKKHVMYWDNYKHLLQQIAKKLVPKFIRMKKLYRQKNMQSFSKVIMLAHCILFAPLWITLMFGANIPYPPFLF
jgi:hypothetical protein